MAGGCSALAEVLEKQGAIAQALQHRLSAVDFKQKLVDQNPGAAEYRHNLAAERINTIVRQTHEASFSAGGIFDHCSGTVGITYVQETGNFSPSKKY